MTFPFDLPQEGDHLLGPEEVTDLEEQIKESMIPMTKVLKAFGVARLSQLKQEKLVDVLDWLDAQEVIS